MARSFGSGKSETGWADHQSALDGVLEELPPLVVIHGPGEFLRLEAVRALRTAWLAGYPGGDVVSLRAAGETRPLAYSDVTAELSGSGLFAKDKLVVVRQAERLLFPAGRSAGEQGDGGAEAQSVGKEKLFVDYLDRPASGIWLALETAQLPKNRVMGKKLAAQCRLVPCPELNLREAQRWLSARAGSLGKRLGAEAAETLLMAHGADLGVLASEVDKLALFVGEEETIDAEAVGQFLTGTVEFDIFGLTNAVEERNAAAAVSFARRIAVQGSRDQRGKRDDGERSAHRALAMLAGSAQGLLRAGTALMEKTPPGDFAAAEKLSPWRAERLLRAAGRYNLRELRLMAGMTADMIRRSHDTGGDARLALELLAVGLTGRF